jgi:tryptophanyl-tRNA synthetase
MATIFSGMQPTGEIHLGNWMGALRQWVALSRSTAPGGGREHDCIFSVVDAHSLTIEYDSKELPKRVFETALAYLAAGVDDRAIVMVQSDVREHTELAWYLSCVAPMGELGRMTQFKEKTDDHRHVANAGLFTYPILMAADILLYKATLVPVGHDQIQHLEFARDLTRHFAARFKREVFPEPRPHPLTLRIKGTDGHEKMSKSRNNSIAMLETPSGIWKRLKGAFTDPQRVTREIPGRPEVCNIFTMHGAVSTPERVEEVRVGCSTAGIGCGDCKKLLAESLETELGPIRARAEELRAKPDVVIERLRAGAAECRRRAGETMREVRDVMGLRSDADR